MQMLMAKLQCTIFHEFFVLKVVRALQFRGKDKVMYRTVNGQKFFCLFTSIYLKTHPLQTVSSRKKTICSSFHFSTLLQAECKLGILILH